jgi:hypothetical protein
MTRFSVATVAAAVIVFAATTDARVAGQKVRSLRWGQPIVSSLLPDDEIVLVYSGAVVMPAPYGVVRTRESELKDLARWEELAIIQQATPQSFFVNNGTWLNTRVQARVIQTLKTGRLVTAHGTAIEFEHEGGELQVKGVIVRSAEGVSFENSKRYLVAVRFEHDRQKWRVVVMFELDNEGVLRKIIRRDGSTSISALHGLSLSEVSNAISKGVQ